MAVHFNPLTQEPYLRLPEPHSNIIITPYRADKIDETVTRVVELLNDPRIYMWLETTPVPYLREHGVEWVTDSLKQTEGILAILQREFAKEGGMFSSQGQLNGLERPQQYFDVCPFTCIREVLAADAKTGAPLNDILIGDIKLGRYTFYEHPLGSEERDRARRENDALPAGDENIIWTLGGKTDYCSRINTLTELTTWPDYLAPSHHGKGIMSLAMKTLIHDWAVPYMNVRNLKCYLFKGNAGSLRVFEKNNFEKERILEDWVPVAECRGGRKSIVVMRWRGL